MANPDFGPIPYPPEFLAFQERNRNRPRMPDVDPDLRYVVNSAKLDEQIRNPSWSQRLFSKLIGWAGRKFMDRLKAPRERGRGYNKGGRPKGCGVKKVPVRKTSHRKKKRS